MKTPISRLLRDGAGLRNLRIKARLRLAFLCVLVLMFAGSGVTFWYLQKVRARVVELSVAERRLTAALQINNDLVRLVSRLYRAAEGEDSGYFEAEAQWLLAEFHTNDAEKITTLRSIAPANGREKLVLDTVASIADALPHRVSEMNDLARAGDWIALHARLTDQVDHTDDAADDLMQEAEADVSRERDRTLQDIRDTERDAARALIITGLLGLVTAACLGLAVTHSITRPLAALTAGTMVLARGEFNSPVDLKGTDELAALAAVLNRTSRDLSELYGELHQKNRALQHANDDLNVFAYSASHDLQEPLRNVMLYSQLLQREYAGRLDGQADEFLNCMSESAERMSELLKDLLCYIQVSNSEIDAARPASASIAVGKALANLQNAVYASRATLVYDGLPSVAVEPIQLQQLFQNLIGNAIKYRGNHAPHIQISAEEATSFWCFSVKDNGIGISSRYSESIFGLFKRLHGQGKYPGTGIGLAICQKIVQRYGGNIWVESQPGEGSNFKFTLPKAGGDYGDEFATDPGKAV